MVGLPAIIISNDIGAYYQGTVFDRFLRVRLTDGEIISVFDPDVLSDDLAIGSTCIIVLSILTTSFSFRISGEGQDSDDLKYVGEIVDVMWTPEPHLFDRFSPSLFPKDNLCLLKWILVEFQDGHIVLDSHDFPDEVKIEVGTKVTWSEQVRWDLLAYKILSGQ